ncbi:MAG: hypothetical protein AB7P12_01930 [Alphaproteobacteria bacterium]
MYDDEPIPHPHKARKCWIGSIAPLIVAMLLLDLPLGVLYGLKAELRHLSPSISGSSADVIDQVYSSDTVLPTLAINNGPEDAIFPHPVEAPTCHVCALAFVDGILFPIRAGNSSNAFVQVDGESIPDPPRSYDPHAPPAT